MMETIKMSSKGQIVIPQNIRNDLNAKEGTIFAVIRSSDTVILKKVVMPSKEDLIRDLKKMAKEGKKHLQAKGFTEADLRSK